LSLFKRKGGAFLGGHISWQDRSSVNWNDKVFKDKDFQDLCANIFYSAIPPKARLARLFEVRGFKLEDSRWDEDTAAMAFSKIIARENSRHFERQKTHAIRLKGNPSPPPRVVGIDADGSPYAWSPTVWK